MPAFRILPAPSRPTDSNGSAPNVDEVRPLISEVLLPAHFFVKRADVADEGRNSGYGCNQEVIGAAALGIQGEATLGNFPHEQFVPDLQLVKFGSQFALGHQLKKEFQFAFVGRRDYRVRPFRPLVRTIYAERRILPWREFEFATGLNSDGPKIGSEIGSLGDSSAVKLVETLIFIYGPLGDGFRHCSPRCVNVGTAAPGCPAEQSSALSFCALTKKNIPPGNRLSFAQPDSRGRLSLG